MSPAVISAVASIRTLHPRLYALAIAMQKFEGFIAQRGPKSGSRSWRNNNPGNLRDSGLTRRFAEKIEDGYAIFPDYYTGLFTMLLDLQAKSMGRTSTGLGPTSTIKQLITTWAPPHDNNDPDAYTRFVCEATGLKPESRLAELLWDYPAVKSEG